ncbi:tetrahydromethanopterin S-methyltransferase subunit F [Methanoculleus bourgensis]|jgi:tetrahydromethanopterin S-methyltransferase subunit F|uniref:Tetrahydromethanopterin S-methyltransferase subunit F n=1 Tax=Methanoculleus bourgensis TaxID=83986 RepID=A0A0X3BPR4_9EURY|nr:tetrahydromethanopterin S-methyltransferase subunit F [Methanoculleus bourgensis]MBT0732224.1 tetrahydromethanopterin S-methyltransferase subunit F [Methanoculleus bourgensis]MDD3372198.1 tetrahydromethanopterin S-methyltransferase subunit F [Methanoculleus bourgensis]NQS77286.1 tetrahydromethanopterin S-methyltransferase subunit F [Methanoculleus bourgensis]CVK33455.1 Tetrahydromethanopterin S-methyltransferase subunit F [Methanoculleus bourgensis]GLI45970.1 tetrahydromethanopterin S-methy
MAEEGIQTAGPIRMTAINRMMDSIRYKAQILARTTKLESGIMGSGILGFAIGIIVAMLLIVIPVLILGMI